MKVICDDKIPFIKGVLEPFATVEYYPGAKITPDLVTDADAIITRTRTNCNQSLLEKSKVKFIGTATIGFDHIDTKWVESHGITWTNAPGCNSGSVKQYIAAALAFIATKKGVSLQNKTIGIIGVGNVGSKIIEVAKAFGMKVLLNDPPRQRNEKTEFVSFDRIVEEADIITFHVPLNQSGIDKTFHLVDKSTVEKLKKGVVIINTSRGEVIETDALRNGLERQIISEAIIDVWENEPNISLELMHQCTIATPHIAGYSLDGKALGTAMTVMALCKHFHLPLTNWFPTGLQMPKEPIYQLNCHGKTTEQALCEAILHTYCIDEDKQRFITNPSTFEEQRGNYPLRREFGVYHIELSNPTQSIIDGLNRLGFGQVSTY